MRDLVAVAVSATTLVLTGSLVPHAVNAAPMVHMVGAHGPLAEKATCRCHLGLNCICRPYWAPAWGWRAPGWAAGVPGAVWGPKWDWGDGIFGGPAAGLYGPRYPRYRSRSYVNDQGWSGEDRWPPK